MKKVLLLISLFAITIGSLSAEEKGSLNVGTYNLRMDTPQDKENAWTHRKDMVNGLVRFHDFDIFGTQEGFVHQLKDIRDAGTYDYVGVGRDDGKEEGEHSAIFYKKERFTVLDKGDYWLSTTPETPSFGWDARIRRICSWAKFKDKVTGKEFFFFSVHYDHQGKEARHESSKLMIAKIKSIAGNLPFFCVGDFNASPEDDPIQVIYKDGTLIDSHQVTKQAPYGSVGTFNGYKIDAPLKNRIDYIFVSKNITVSKYGVLNDLPYGRFPSDHYPVMIRAEL